MPDTARTDPHERHYRMRLLSWMNGVKADARVRMKNTRLGEPPHLQLPHSRPVQVSPLAATDENLPPQPSNPPAEYVKTIGVARYRVIVEVALHNRPEPFPGSATGSCIALLELLLNFCQLPPQALVDRVTLHREIPVPSLPADMRESQKVECFRLPFSSVFPVVFGTPPELDPARFGWV